MSIKSLIATSLLAASAISLPASAGMIFQDDFDTDSGTSVLNFDSLINWTVSGGTIDYVRSGDFGVSCVGGMGGCLDMDGSTSDAGRITSKQLFTFDNGVEYFIDASVSGNQRGAASDSVAFGLIRESDSAMITASFGPIASDAPFAVLTASFFGGSATGEWRLFFEGIGGDDIGVILDNVSLRDDRAAVPEPAALALVGLALAVLRFARRGKQ